MKKALAILVVAIMTTLSVQAQKIQVVNSDGNAIPLASVMTEDGILIGTTDLDGRIAVTKGTATVTVTHVAYQPKLVSLASLADGRITMESVDYGLDEIVVKPKPYLYLEYYFRAFSYIDDSLRVYTAGIIPVAYDIQNNYKGKTRSVWTFGGAANKALTWNTEDLELKAEECAKDGARSIAEMVNKSEKFKDYYKVSTEQDGKNRWIVRNPEEVLGHYQYSDGQYHATLDVGKMKVYANKANDELKQQKVLEGRNYDYQYSEVYALDDEEKVQLFNKVMEIRQLEYDSKKGRKISIIYLYSTERRYMDDNEFKARTKELNKGQNGNMSLEELQEYEVAQNIPPLADSQQKAIQALEKKTGKKKDK